MIDDELRDCRICGGAASVLSRRSAFSPKEYWHVSCSSCKAVSAEYDSRDAAIEAWNSGRVRPDAKLGDVAGRVGKAKAEGCRSFAQGLRDFVSARRCKVLIRRGDWVDTNDLVRFLFDGYDGPQRFTTVEFIPTECVLQLADLIDRPTCMREAGAYEAVCSNCGVECIGLEDNFCPNCGSEVIDDED